MEQPARIDIHADRWVACVREIAFVGFDFTGATFTAQVRAQKDSTGTPLVNLGTVTTSSAEGVRLIYGGTDTITNHIAANRLDSVPSGVNAITGQPYQTSDSIPLSSIGIRINETTMEGLPEPDDLGDDLTLVWDMHITPTSGLKEKYCGGLFLVRAGVTQ